MNYKTLSAWHSKNGKVICSGS